MSDPSLACLKRSYLDKLDFVDLAENFIIYIQERPRPEYAAKAPTYEENPITRVKEPYFPPRQRLPRILSGIAVIIIMVHVQLQPLSHGSFVLNS